MKRIIFFVLAFSLIMTFAHGQNTSTIAASIGRNISTILHIQGNERTWGKDSFEIRDRVPSSRPETCNLYAPNGNTIIFNGHPWSNKFRGQGLMLMYDQNSGYYKASIDNGIYNTNADNHLVSKGIALKNGKIYAIAEENHGQIFDMFRGSMDDMNFYKLDTCSGGNARGEFYELGNSSFVVAYQRYGVNLSIRTLDSLTEQLNNFKDLVIPDAVGKRIYTSRPMGAYKINGWYYQVIYNSSSEAFEECFVWKTQDWVNFYSLDETVTINIPNSASAVTCTTLRNYTGKFKFFGTQNAGINIPNTATCIGDDGVFRYIGIDEVDHNKQYFGRFTGSAFSQSITSLPGGFFMMPGALEFNFNAINNNAGKQQMQFNGVDIVREFTPTKKTYYSPYLRYVTVLSKTFSGGNTLITLDTAYNAAHSTGYARPATPPDYGGLYWMQHKNGITYAAILVLDETQQIYDAVRQSNYPAFRYRIFRTSNNGSSWIDMGDAFPNVPYHNIHKFTGPQNFIPNNKNFVFVGCLYAYGVTEIDKDIMGSVGSNTGNPLTGQIYTTRGNFGPLQPEANIPVGYTGDNVTWSIKYDAAHVNTTGSVITQLNDQSGNSRNATAVGSPQLANSAINTLGSSYFTIPSYTSFYNDTKFTFACVLQKTNEGYLLSFANDADAFQHVGVKVKMGGVGSKYIQYVSSPGDEIKARGNVLGSGYYILVVMCNGYNVRMFVNGVEMNKDYVMAGTGGMERWVGYFGSALIDNMIIGGRKNSSIETAPLTFKYWAYKSDSAISDYNRKKLEKYLASTYSITLGSFGAAGTFQPETEIAFSRAGGSPTDAEKKDVDDLVVAIKTRQGLPLHELSLGNKFDQIYILAAKYQAVAVKNLARPFYDLTSSGTVTYTSDQGYRSNGTTGYFNTSFNPSLNSSWVVNDFAFGGYVVTDVTRGNKGIAGSRVSTNITTRLYPRTAADITIGTIGQGSGSTASTSMPGFYACTRFGTTLYVQRENVEVTTVTSTQPLNNQNLFLLAEDADGSPAQYFDGTVGFWYWGGGASRIDRFGMRADIRNWFLLKGVIVP
jgi:hypothetical protein